MTEQELNQKVFCALGDKAMVIAMEELAELQQAISKGIRGKLNEENLAEELADVSIIMEWVRQYYEIVQDDILDWKYEKRLRIKDKLERGEFK